MYNDLISATVATRLSNLYVCAHVRTAGVDVLSYLVPEVMSIEIIITSHHEDHDTSIVINIIIITAGPSDWLPW